MAEIGDKVYDLRYGWGTIDNIDNLYGSIIAKYEVDINEDIREILCSYNLEGKCHDSDLVKMLWKDKPLIIDKELLDILYEQEKG